MKEANFPPLNQSYRIAETKAARPEVARIMEDFERWALETVRYCPHDTYPSFGKPGKLTTGRSWDAALTLASIDFRGLKVAEFGARSSFLSPYLTKDAAEVHVSDIYGKGHKECGPPEKWEKIWRDAAFNPDRLHCSVRDMVDSGYDDEIFDVVMTISAIEHIKGDGDMMAAAELARILRPGGLLVIGTDMAEEYRVHAGHYYDEKAIRERLVEPSCCVPYGPTDLSWEGADHSQHRDRTFWRTCCLFVLQKPGKEK